MKAPRTLSRRRWLCSTDRCGAQSKGWDAEAAEATAWTKLVQGPTVRSALYMTMNAREARNLTGRDRFARAPSPGATTAPGGEHGPARSATRHLI